MKLQTLFALTVLTFGLSANSAVPPIDPEIKAIIVDATIDTRSDEFVFDDEAAATGVYQEFPLPDQDVAEETISSITSSP